MTVETDKPHLVPVARMEIFAGWKRDSADEGNVASVGMCCQEIDQPGPRTGIAATSLISFWVIAWPKVLKSCTTSRKLPGPPVTFWR